VAFSRDIQLRLCIKALSIGLKYYKTVFPNPPVGAIIVKNGKIISIGAHEKAGSAHAEVNAISAAGDLVRDSDLYVSLEPCNHHGRTPPCSEAILKAGIKRVIYLTSDHTSAAGGANFLSENGVSVFQVQSNRKLDAYLSPWSRYKQNNIKSVSLILNLDLNGNLLGDNLFVENHYLSKRFQLLKRGSIEIQSVEAYDIGIQVGKQAELQYYLALIKTKNVFLKNLIILRHARFSANSEQVDLEELGEICLESVRIYKGVCMEIYRAEDV
jgi:pyrimidine deaminase RibD-like protein